MRHGKKFNHLSRTAPHRKAMLSNMSSSLIEHKRISTTVAKAKALRKYVEPLITKAKTDTTHSRRVVFSYLQNKESITELFGDVANKVANRPGGYTRIIRTGNRLGDNAEMCIIELVDYNENLLTDATPTKKKRSRRGGKKKSEATPAVDGVVEEAEVVEAADDTTEEAVVEESAEETVEEVVAEDTEEVIEEPVAEVEEVVAEAEEVVEEPTAEVEEVVAEVEEVVEEPAAEVEETPEASAEGDDSEAASEDSGEEEKKDGE